MKNELDTELTDVAAVYNRIDEIETIDTAIQSINDGELNAVAAVEDLTVQGPVQRPRISPWSCRTSSRRSPGRPPISAYRPPERSSPRCWPPD